MLNLVSADSDSATFEVPLTYSAISTLGTMGIEIDGGPMPLVNFSQGPNQNCLLTFQTSFNQPGLHLLAPVFRVSGAVGDATDPTVLSAFGAVTPYTINGSLTFQPFYSTLSDHAWLYAELTQPLAGYTISLYDPSTTPATLINTFSGSTGTDVIKVYWDRSDRNGNRFTGDSVNAVFQVTPNGGSPETHSQFMFGVDSPEPGDGPVTVAFAWDEPSQIPAMTPAIQVGVVDNLLNPYVFGQTDAYLAADPSFNAASQGGLGGRAGYCPNNTYDQKVLDALALGRNFYFAGHGSSTTISSKKKYSIYTDFVLNKADVGLRLGNGYRSVHGRTVYAQGHKYRFVFLDACETADATWWSEAFGILPGATPWLYLTDEPLKAQAFVGWFGEPRAPWNSSTWVDYGRTLNVIFQGWMFDRPLQQLLNMAQKTDPYGDGSVTLNFPLALKFDWIQENVWRYKNTFKIQVFGYNYITRTGWQ